MEQPGQPSPIPYARPGASRGRRRPFRRFVFRAALVCASLFAFTIAILVVSIPAREAAWYMAFARRIPDERARGNVATYAGGADRLPASFRVLKAVELPGRDSTRWYKVQVDPRDVAALKRSIRTASAEPLDDADDLSDLTEVGFATPGWWEPDHLPDPDVLQGLQEGYVFSQKTGLVYIVWMDF